MLLDRDPPVVKALYGVNEMQHAVTNALATLTGDRPDELSSSRLFAVLGECAATYGLDDRLMSDLERSFAGLTAPATA